MILCDNQSAIFIAKNDTVNDRSKHFVVALQIFTAKNKFSPPRGDVSYLPREFKLARRYDGVLFFFLFL